MVLKVKVSSSTRTSSWKEGGSGGASAVGGIAVERIEEIHTYVHMYVGIQGLLLQ